MSLKNTRLAILFVCGAFALFRPSAVAAPVCDNACRERSYFYITLGGGSYRKYQTPTCELCKTPSSLCLVQTGDNTTGATCTTMAGQENGNKYWAITSTSVCDFTNQFYIEANSADPTDPMAFTVCAIKYCPMAPG